MIQPVPPQKTGSPEKGVKGFELDIHVTFSAPLPEAQAIAALRVLEGFRVDLYRPHPQAISRHVPDTALTDAGVPSARLTGPLHDAEAVRAALAALLGGPARSVEVGVRSFLRSAEGQTEWMPWRVNRVLSRHQTAQLPFEPGVRYVLE